MNPIVSIEHLSFAYNQTMVLKDVSFNVFPGEFVGIIGPNGGGKTTLLKLIMGFLTPSSGEIRVFNKPVMKALPQISYVPQNTRFDREFPISVIEVVLSGRLFKLPWYGRYTNEDYEIAKRVLNQVGMASFSDKSFGTLSGGQAQRTLIARALASNPQLLLLDEPTASVDSQAEADIHGILQELKRKITILMVTHDLRAVINQVERVLCVQGSILPLMPNQVCEHFAFGLYHPPLINPLPTPNNNL
jgi:zinc transport system ATP-binding protein